jgi:Phage integrase, N-terminal SAM-like domain
VAGGGSGGLCGGSAGKKQGQGRPRWRARYRDPSGRERSKSFARKVDAERFLVAVEDAKLRGAYVDPAAGRVPFAEWAERWEQATATLRPSTRKDYATLLKNQVIPEFGDMMLAGIDALAVREWVAELEALAGRMEDARSEALATLARTQRGPAVVPLREGAGR